MTTYTHKENNSVKNYGEVLREFNDLRRTDDEFARDYRSTECQRYIQDNYITNVENSSLKRDWEHDIEVPKLLSHNNPNLEPPNSIGYPISNENLKKIQSLAIELNVPIMIPNQKLYDPFTQDETISNEDIWALAKKEVGDSVNDGSDLNAYTLGYLRAMTQRQSIQAYKLNNFPKWVERLDNILLSLETHSLSINQVSIDDLANLIAEMKNNKQ